MFTRNYNWVSDRNSAIPITASRVDADSNDFASGLSMVVTRDGQGPVTSLLNVNGVGATPFIGTGTSDNVGTYLVMNKGHGAHTNSIFGCNNGLLRWQFEFGNTTVEAGGGSGSDFALDRYNDSGVYVDSPITVARSTGVVTIANLNVLSGITAPISATNISASGTLSIGGNSIFTGVATFNASPLSITRPSGQQALVQMNATRVWQAGQQTDGTYIVYDGTAGLTRLTIDSTGLFTVGGKVAAQGLSFGSVVAPGGALDLSRHIALWGTSYGFSVTGGTLNIVSSGAATMALTSSGASITGTLVSTGNMTCNGNFATNAIQGSTIIAFTNLQVSAGAASAQLYLTTNARQWSIWSSVGDGFLYFYDNSAGALRMYVTTAGNVVCTQSLTVSGNFNTNAISGSTITCTTINTQGNHADLGNINVAANGVAYNRVNSGAYFEFGWPSGTQLNFYVNGTLRGFWGFNSPSDERIKENIAAAEGDALGELRAVKLISYDQILMRDPDKTHTTCGFSAQQMETVIPEAVMRGRVEPEDPERDLKAKPYTYDEVMLGIDVMPLLARLVGAVQQLAARIETLEARA